MKYQKLKRALTVIVACAAIYGVLFAVMRKRTIVTDVDYNDRFVIVKGYYFSRHDLRNKWLCFIFYPVWHSLLRSKSAKDFDTMGDVVEYSQGNGRIYLDDSRFIVGDSYYWYDYFGVKKGDAAH